MSFDQDLAPPGVVVETSGTIVPVQLPTLDELDAMATPPVKEWLDDTGYDDK